MRPGEVNEEVTPGCAILSLGSHLGRPHAAPGWPPGCFCPVPVGACPVGLLLQVQLGRNWEHRPCPVSQVRF